MDGGLVFLLVKHRFPERRGKSIRMAIAYNQFICAQVAEEQQRQYQKDDGKPAIAMLIPPQPARCISEKVVSLM